MLGSEESKRIDLLRFPLIVGVVFIHNYATTVRFAGSVAGRQNVDPTLDFVRSLISQSLARVAVPLFFLISGFLFFSGFTWSWERFWNKLLSRTRTLLVPFLFWNLITLFIVLLGQSISSLQPFFAGTKLAERSIWELMAAILGIGRMPIAYQFWFIRDLMLLVVMAPAIAVVPRTGGWILVAALFGFWLAGGWPLMSPSAEATLFYVLGAEIAKHQLSLFRLDRLRPWATLLWIVLAVLDTLQQGTVEGMYVHKVAICVGVIGALSLSKNLVQNERVRGVLLWLGSASFFVYAAHEPTLTIFRKLTFRVLRPESSVALLLLYITLPLIVIAVVTALYVVLRKAVPTFTAIIVGNRRSR